MQATAGKVAGFTGSLVRRNHEAGAKYAQLVFHTAEGPRLSVTQNIKMALSLQVGHNYHVKGREYSIGNTTILRDISATVVNRSDRLRRHLKLAVAFMVLVPAVGYAGVIYAQGQRSENQRAVVPAKVAEPAPAKPAPVVAAVAPAPAATPPVAAPVTAAPKVTPRKKTATAAPKPVVAAPVVPVAKVVPPQQAPAVVDTPTLTPEPTLTETNVEAPAAPEAPVTAAPVDSPVDKPADPAL